MEPEGDVDDRRHRSDRRARGEESGPAQRRGSSPAHTTSVLANLLRSVGFVLVLLVVIVGTVRMMRPVYATRGTLGDELRKRAPGAALAIGAGDSSEVDRLMATDKFQDEKRNFYEDVMRLKQVDSARADSIAQYAVREAYKRGISPALIFGVMLTENARFISNATSNVGAVGLMQVYPKVWLNKEMTRLFGKDLASDSTNVKYGVFILNHYFNPKTKTGATRPRDWQTALLRYNGCVRGTNTPRCHTYPNKVQKFVENQATSICNGRPFYECIAKPFITGLFGHGNATTASAATTPAPAVAAPAVAAPAAAPVVIPPLARQPAPVRISPSPAPAKLSPLSPGVKGTMTRRVTANARKSVAKKSSSAPRKTSRAPMRKARVAAPTRTSTAKKAAAKRPAARRPATLTAPKAVEIRVRVP